MPPAVRRFSVHVRHEDSRRARIVEESSFAAAAVAYVEDFAPIVDHAENDISIMVRDLAGGREHCIRIDLHTGEAAPCGAPPK